MKIKDFIISIESDLKRTSSKLEEKKRIKELKEVARKYEGDDEVISCKELIERIKQRPDEEKFLTGLTQIDELLKGFRPEQLITISGLTGSGKTTFSMELTARLAKYNPLWLPFEESGEELIQKFLERGDEPPDFYVPENLIDNTIEWIEKKTIEAIAKYNSRMIFIDHIEFIVPFSARRHDLMVGDTMRKLKTVAKKWNVCVFLLVHLKKASMDRLPDINDLKNSSSIGQESDTVMIVWRKTERGQMTDDTLVSIQKNRKVGRLGNIKMIFRDNKFYEHDWNNEPRQTI